MKTRIITIIATVALLVFFCGLAVNTVSKFDGLYENVLSQGNWPEQKAHIKAYLDYMNGKTSDSEFFSSELFSFTETERKYLSNLQNTIAAVNTVEIISAIAAIAAIAYLLVLEKREAFKHLLKAFLIGGAIVIVLVVAGQIWCANNKEGMLYFINSFAGGGITDIFSAPSLPTLFSIPFFARIVRGSLTITGILVILTVLLLWFLREVTNKKNKDEDYLYQ